MDVTERNLLSQDVCNFDDARTVKEVYTDHVSEFRGIIRKKLKEKGWTHKALAERVGVSRPAVTNWLTPTGDFHFPTHETLMRLCRTLDLEFMVDKSADPVHVRWVPVIPWPAVLSIERGEIIESLLKEERVPASLSVSRKSFALKVRGESMAPSFPEGSIIIVDPEREARQGNAVIVQVLSQPEVIFRVYLKEGTETFLEPVNARYPLTRLEKGEFKILGVVVQKIESCI